jgi:hypothetical protein
MNCIGNNPSLFLQRLYSENSPQNCSETGAPAALLLSKVITLATSLPTVEPFRNRHRSKYAM